MSNRDYALFLFERQKRAHFRRLKALIRARLTRSKPGDPTSMGYQKHYLNNLLCACVPDNGFAQDAIEYALVSNHVRLSGTHDLETDVRIVMGQYDQIVEAYHQVRQEEALVPCEPRDRLLEAA